MTFGGAGLIAGGAIGGALISGAAGQSAASTQANAANQATNAQMAMFNKTQGNLQPFVNFGNGALGTYNALLGLGGGTGAGGAPNTQAMMTALSNTPGFQFTNYWGQQGVQNSMAARGLGSSGAALKAAGNYATGLASQNYQNILGDYASAAGLGENAAAGLGNAATATGQGIAGTLQNAGAASAAGINSMGAGINNALLSAGAYGAMGLNYNNYNTLMSSGMPVAGPSMNFSMPTSNGVSVGNIWGG